MAFGLPQRTMEKITGIFEAIKKVDHVMIFGSRALGRHKEGSDIDLAVFGENLKLDDILDLHVKLEDLNLPYRFDIVNMDQPVEESLKSHIERVGIKIFNR